MKVNRKVSTAVLLGMLLVLAVFAAGCMEQDVNASSDSLACVYDGSRDGGQRLKHQVPPGQHIQTGADDIIVKIPTSNRFFMAAKDSQIRDPLAPKYYTGYDKNNVAMQIQGQVRFRFNIDRACEWYAKHGRRNAHNNDLGFNERDPVTQPRTGWAKFLAENFGFTMGQVVQERSGDYQWQDLVYHKRIRGTDADIAYGNDLARMFTDRLNQALGGEYFCGTSIPEKGAADQCPRPDFQVLRVAPANSALIQARVQKVEQTDLLANAEAENEILRLQLAKAKLRAQIRNASCIALAEHGLDCNGQRPNIIVGGGGGK